MKNSNPAFTLSGRTKVFLFICLGAMAIIDFAAFVYLTATGAAATFWIFPLLFFIADAIFIVQTAFSNFRFKYTIGEIVFYILLTFIVLMSTVSRHLGGTVSVFTSTAGTIWCLIHVLSIAAALICYLFTAKRFRSKVLLQSLVAIAVSAVCAVTAVAYVVLLVDFGFFGQGSDVRPLAYEYDETSDSYSVTGVLEGNGENAVVPKEFNGKPVTQVSSAIFSSDGIKSVTLECSSDVEFTDIGYYMNDGLKIYTDRDKIDEFRRVFFNLDFDLANSLAPCGLDGDEVYVTFGYDTAAYSQVNGEILPTWIGKKGDKLDISYFKDIPYAAHNDKTSDEDLYWNFNNNKKCIISGIYAGETNILGSEITSDIGGATVEFEKIYRVFPGSSNDTKYAASEGFGFSQNNGAKLDYKLTVAENADKIISGISREGFTVNWLQSQDSYTTPTVMSSIKGALEKLSSDKTDLYVHPSWDLNAPLVTLSKDKDSVEYGGDITLSATVTPPVAGMQVIYNWRKTEDGYTFCSTKDYAITNIAYGETGYILVATVQGDNTSLTSQTVKAIPLEVTKRQLTVSWNVPDDLVYNGEDKVITCGIDGRIINDDRVGLSLTRFNHRNAGTYTDEVSLTGANSEKYAISAGQTIKTTVEKADLTVNWLTTETVYNGETQYPEVSVEGVYNNEVEYQVSGFKDANATNSTYPVQFTATKGGENYNIINPTSRFLIKKFPLSVEWHDDCGATFTYDGRQHAISATAVGVNGGTVSLSTNIGTLKNAGVYEITAFTVDTNYEITSNSTKTYTVEKYGLTVQWGETELTYNGRQQAPEYTMRGVEGDGNILGGLNGLQKEVGENYICTAHITAQNDHEKNYVIANNEQITYSIKPAEVEVQWTVASYYYYNGREQAPTAYIRGLGDDSSVSLGCTVTGAINAGTHTAKAVLNHALAKNYTLKNDTKLFTIGVTLIEVSVHDFKITYGIAVPEKFVYTVSQLAEGDEVAEVFSVSSFEIENKVEVNGYVKPGEYSINAIIEKNGAKAGNYSVQVEKGTLTVEKKEVTVKINDAQITLGDELPAFTYTADGLVAETPLFKNYKIFEGEITGAGTYHIAPDEYSDGINDLYVLKVSYGTLTVVAAEVEDEV